MDPKSTPAAPAKLEPMLRSAAYLAGSGVVAQLLRLPVGIITRLVLGPRLIGLTSTLDLANNYANYTNLGVMRAAARELPYSRGAGDEARAREIAETTLAISFVTGGMSAVVVVALGILLLADVGRPEVLAALAIYALAAIPGQVWGHYLVMVFSAERFALLGRVVVASTVAYAVVAITGVYLWGIYGFLAAFAVHRALPVVLLRLFLPEGSRVRFHRAEFRRLLVMGLPMAASAFLFSINVTADELGVVWMLGQQALGVYSVAILGKAYLWQVGNAFIGVWNPRLQLLYGQSHDAKALARTVLDQCRLLAFSAPVLFGMMFLAAQALVGLFLHEYVGGVAPLQVLLVALHLRVVRGLLGIYIVTIKKQNISLALGAIATPLTLLVVVLWVRAGGGLEGAAAGATLGALVHYTLTGAYFSSKARRPAPTFLQLLALTLPIGYAYGVLTVLEGWVPWVPGEPLLAAVVHAGLRAGLYLLGMLPLVLFLYRLTPAWAMAKAAFMSRVSAAPVDHPYEG